MNTNKTLLRNALIANAVFSFSSGLSLLLFSSFFVVTLPLPGPVSLWVIGGGLLLFVMLLLYTATRKAIPSSLVHSIIIMDLAWVLGSLVILVWDPLQFSFNGKLLIGGVALVVGVLALVQKMGLNRMRSTPS